METSYFAFRDPETGKILEFIGGQEPREIDEEWAKKRFGDIEAIPFLPKADFTGANVEKTICPNCGSPVEKANFCTVCGAKL